MAGDIINSFLLPLSEYARENICKNIQTYALIVNMQARMKTKELVKCPLLSSSEMYKKKARHLSSTSLLCIQQAVVSCHRGDAQRWTCCHMNKVSIIFNLWVINSRRRKTVETKTPSDHWMRLKIIWPGLTSGKTLRVHLDESYRQKHSGFGVKSFWCWNPHVKARSFAAGRKNKIAVKNCRGSPFSDPSGKKITCCLPKFRQEVSGVRNLKIASPESECLFFSDFLQSGKGSWENQISSGEAVSVWEVGQDQSITEKMKPVWKTPRKAERGYQRREKVIISLFWLKSQWKK